MWIVCGTTWNNGIRQNERVFAFIWIFGVICVLCKVKLKFPSTVIKTYNNCARLNSKPKKQNSSEYGTFSLWSTCSEQDAIVCNFHLICAFGFQFRTFLGYIGCQHGVVVARIMSISSDEQNVLNKYFNKLQWQDKQLQFQIKRINIEGNDIAIDRFYCSKRLNYNCSHSFVEFNVHTSLNENNSIWRLKRTMVFCANTLCSFLEHTWNRFARQLFLCTYTFNNHAIFCLSSLFFCLLKYHT